jgi:hypothetical protein
MPVIDYIITSMGNLSEGEFKTTVLKKINEFIMKKCFYEPYGKCEAKYIIDKGKIIRKE